MNDAPSSSAGRPVVILIEDDSRVAPALAMLIEDWGFKCLAVRNPQAAIADLDALLSDAIAVVVDVSRNDAFTGRRSAEAINEAIGSTLPRIVTTNEPALARAHGYSDVLAKPYDPETLHAWLIAQARRRSASDECASKAS